MSISVNFDNIANSVTDIIALIKGKVPPDTIEELAKLETQISINLIKAQTQVNTAEAQNSNIFVAGWRPFIGWSCGITLFLYFVGMPIIHYIGMLFGHYVPQLILPIDQVVTLVTGMLGISALRTVDKIKDVATNYVKGKRK